MFPARLRSPAGFYNVINLLYRIRQKFYIFVAYTLDNRMTTSQLYNKSQMLNGATTLLHSKGIYPPVAHAAYYSCYQLMLYIWIYKMHKTPAELDALCAQLKQGQHETLIGEIATYINNSSYRDAYKDCRNFSKKIAFLKKLRISSDYNDEVFTQDKSNDSITLMNELTPILKKY